jgi:hypothetical protein
VENRTGKISIRCLSDAIAVFLSAVCTACVIDFPSVPDTSSFQPSAIIGGATVESRLVERHTVEYIEKPVTTVEYVERVVTEPVELRNFYSLDEMNTWLSEFFDTAIVYLRSSGSEIDCDDYALALQRKALKEGYIISFEIIGNGEYNSLFSIPIQDSQPLHAINLAIIGNSAYYIEPQTGEYVLAANLD